jgi:hypothetical protein
MQAGGDATIDAAGKELTVTIVAGEEAEHPFTSVAITE